MVCKKWANILSLPRMLGYWKPFGTLDPDPKPGAALCPRGCRAPWQLLSNPFAWTLIAPIVSSIGLYCDMRWATCGGISRRRGRSVLYAGLLLGAPAHAEKVRSQFLSLRHYISATHWYNGEYQLKLALSPQIRFQNQLGIAMLYCRGRPEVETAVWDALGW